MRKCCWRYTGKHFTHIFFFPLANNKKALLPILVYKIRKETTSKKNFSFLPHYKKIEKEFSLLQTYQLFTYKQTTLTAKKFFKIVFLFEILVSVLKAKDIENSKKNTKILR